MKGAAKSVAGLLFVTVPMCAAPEFTGVLIAPGIELFALADPASNRPTRWVRAGEDFEGYRVAEYFPAAEALSLRSDAGLTRIVLRKGKVTALTPNPDEMLSCAMGEVARREHWAEPTRYQGPHLFKNDWIVVAHHEAAGNTETRVIVFTAGGVMRDYLSEARTSR